MNRKDINDIIKVFSPFSSELIGAPKKMGSMASFLNRNLRSSQINYYGNFDFSALSRQVPDFFKLHDIILTHTNFTSYLESARVWGRNGAVIGDGDYFINDVSREFNDGVGTMHSIYYTIKQVQSKYLTGNTAVIGTAGANVYYHWMLDILPRLSLISKSISLNAVDHFITEFRELPFQTETLKKVGIPTEKIIASNVNSSFHIKAASLWVPSLVGPLDQPTLFQVNFLQSLYEDVISNKAPFRKVYISREKVGRRKIVNENELLSILLNQEFEVVCCEEMTVAQQVVLFSEAATVICSHGSALTNLVFCQPGTKILDIFNPSHINPCFWFISQIKNLEYHYISGKSSPIDNNPKNDNTVVDIDEFKKVFNRLASSAGAVSLFPS